MKTLKLIAQTTLLFCMITSCDHDDPTIFPSNSSNYNQNFVATLTATQSHASLISYDPLIIHVDINGESDPGTSPRMELVASHLQQPMEGKNQYDGQFLLSFYSGEILNGTYIGNGVVTNVGTITETDIDTDMNYDIPDQYLEMMVSEEPYYSEQILNITQQYIITGGTGKYENARGSLSVVISDYNSSNPFTMFISGFINTPDLPEAN